MKCGVFRISGNPSDFLIDIVGRSKWVIGWVALSFNIILLLWHFKKKLSDSPHLSCPLV